MNSLNLNLDEKVQAIHRYLTPKLETQPHYQDLISKLTEVIEKCQQTPISITIISHSKNLLKDIIILKESNLKLRSLCKVQTATLPNNLDIVLRNCDLLCLVNEGSKEISQIEQKLIDKMVKSKSIAYCLILTETLDSSETSQLETAGFDNLPNYLTNKKFQSIPSYLLPKKYLKSTTLPEDLKEYHQFLESLLEVCLIEVEQKFKQSVIDTVKSHFNESKEEYFSEIKNLRRTLPPGKTIDKIKLKTKNSGNKINKLIQNTFKIIKQEVNQGKIQLTNPFIYDTMMYLIQTAIQNASVFEYREQNKTYLSLIIKHKDYNQSIHSYIMELSQREIDLWLEKHWSMIDNDYQTGKINHLVETINQKLEFLNILPFKTTVFKIENKFSFDIADYVSSAILEENNKMVFDYHYSQSALFRIILVIMIVAVVFVLTDRIFGFIILFIQLINLFTGRDPKQIKLRQQTKEMKRTMDSKCQFLARLLADKLLQSLCQSLEKQSQQYQQEVNSIIQKVEEELEVIKQEIKRNNNRIALLEEDEAQIINLLQD